MKNWSTEEINYAIKLHNNGKNFKEIAFELKRTEKSIKEKLKYYNLKQNKENFYDTITCKCCGKIFLCRISENRKFCSKSCSATHTNKGKIKSEKTKQKISNKLSKTPQYEKIVNIKILKTINYCKCCGKILTLRQQIFCSNKCQKKYNEISFFKQIENGTITGTTQTKSRWCKKYLIEKHGENCMKCGWHEINPISNKVPIEIEHIDGNSDNCDLNNIILLCPNCHSLTPTYKALNKGNGRHNRMERYKNGKSY